MKLLIFLMLCGFAASAQTVEYHVDAKAKNVVKFISDAPIEDFEGVTSKIDGYLKHSGSSLSESSDLYFEVDLRTLDTGIGLRNRHMREEYLHTDKYPYAKFSGTISNVRDAGSNSTANVKGTMDIHGVKKTMEVSATLSPTSSGLRAKVSFIVKLTDHNIEVPKFMFLKISEDMKLELDVYLKKVKG
jgi:polyisoprenoid-binding protein YceI